MAQQLVTTQNVNLAPCDSVRTGFLGAMNYKQQALLLMEFQQDAFQQEYGHEMPHVICRKRVADFVMRRYKEIHKSESPEREFDLADCEALFWAVIQLQGREL